METTEKRIEALKKLLEVLPRENKDMIRTIMKHLTK